MADGEVRYEAVFRESWRDRQSAGARPGELIRQPRWIDAGLVALGIALAAGAVAAGTVTVEQSVTLPAVVQGASVTAIRSGEAASAPGTPVQFRDASGTTVGGVVVAVTANEVVAQLARPGAAAAGELLIPGGRQRLFGALLPRLG
jgi:hypothetical protein